MRTTAPALLTPADAFRHFGDILAGLEHEEVWCATVDEGQRVLATVRFGSGARHSATIRMRRLVEAVVADAAAAFVVGHNHPSGDSRPSRSDVEVTRSLVRMSTMLDVPLLDHVIIAGDARFSFRLSGLL